MVEAISLTKRFKSRQIAFLVTCISNGKLERNFSQVDIIKQLKPRLHLIQNATQMNTKFEI